MQSLQREMAHLRMDESEKLRRTETLRYQIDEIERAALKSAIWRTARALMNRCSRCTTRSQT